jgi:transposase
LLLDNARIHHHSNVLETARAMKVNVVFNAEYSSWLDPVESLLEYLKRKVREVEVSTR